MPQLRRRYVRRPIGAKDENDWRDICHTNELCVPVPDGSSGFEEVLFVGLYENADAKTPLGEGAEEVVLRRYFFGSVIKPEVEWREAGELSHVAPGCDHTMWVMTPVGLFPVEGTDIVLLVYPES